MSDKNLKKELKLDRWSLRFLPVNLRDEKKSKGLKKALDRQPAQTSSAFTL